MGLVWGGLTSFLLVNNVDCNFKSPSINHALLLHRSANVRINLPALKLEEDVLT